MQASLHGYYFLSACLGAVAVAFRQTNAVWMAFILGMAILNKVIETDPRAKRLPAEKQLMHVLRTSWKVEVTHLQVINIPIMALGCSGMNKAAAQQSALQPCHVRVSPVIGKSMPASSN